MNRWWPIVALALVAARPAVNQPQLYNEGVTAYRSNEFARAAEAFEQALVSPDRSLQQRAFYNFGNACYRLGQADPARAQKLWQRAIESYNHALALDPQDADAKFNRDFVKKKVEQLPKQQPKQNQRQQKQQSEKKSDQEKNNQQSAANQQPSQENQPPKPQNQPAQKQPPPNQPSPGPKNPHPEKEQPSPASTADQDRLAKQEAAALLDQLRENEQNWNYFPEVQMPELKDRGEPAKDW